MPPLWFKFKTLQVHPTVDEKGGEGTAALDRLGVRQKNEYLPSV